VSDDPAAQIRKALADIERHYDDTLDPARRASGSHVLTSIVDAPLPISADILDKRAHCRARMTYWCIVVIRDRDLHTERLSGFDVPAMADLLRRHSDWLGEQDGLIDRLGRVQHPASELEQCASDLRGIAAPYRRDWHPLGTCPLEVDSEDGPVICGGQVRAYPDKDPFCDTCGTVAVTSWWEKVMFDDPELTRLLTAAELVLFVHNQFGKVVTEVCIRQWIKRGIITRAGSDDKGRTLFDKGAVAYAIERRKILA